jgi:hypothetical protein
MITTDNFPRTTILYTLSVVGDGGDSERYERWGRWRGMITTDIFSLKIIILLNLSVMRDGIDGEE